MLCYRTVTSVPIYQYGTEMNIALPLDVRLSLVELELIAASWKIE